MKFFQVFPKCKVLLSPGNQYGSLPVSELFSYFQSTFNDGISLETTRRLGNARGAALNKLVQYGILYPFTSASVNFVVVELSWIIDRGTSGRDF